MSEGTEVLFVILGVAGVGAILYYLYVSGYFAVPSTTPTAPIATGNPSNTPTSPGYWANSSTWHTGTGILPNSSPPVGSGPGTTAGPGVTSYQVPQGGSCDSGYTLMGFTQNGPPLLTPSNGITGQTFSTYYCVLPSAVTSYENIGAVVIQDATSPVAPASNQPYAVDSNSTCPSGWKKMGLIFNNAVQAYSCVPLTQVSTYMSQGWMPLP